MLGGNARFFCEGDLCFFVHEERTRIGIVARIIVGFGAVIFPSLCFFVWAVCAFRARGRSVMVFWCVFAASRHLARPFLAPSGHHFPFFFSLGPTFWSVGDPPGSFFASWVRKGTHLCRLAPPGHQLAHKQGHQVDFPPSPLVSYWIPFCCFFAFCGI